MIFAGSDMFESDGGGTFAVGMKSGAGGKMYVRVYATSGCVSLTPYVVGYQYTTDGAGWLQAQDLATNPVVGLIGIGSGAVASGSFGWLQVRGQVNDVVGNTASFTGSLGHSVYWGGASTLGATSSAYTGASHQVALLTTEGNGSTVGDIYLVGNRYAESL